ncbi:MAG: glycosyltransferase [Advenella sp.]|uniref:Glycosyltransferase n=1 Tax=Advenella kashmirensis TaxID=310575 RepID=A0A356LBU0_9BURK|nr:glycosyltransferase [Advenella sp. FME57]HBP28031.1 glycosyltransferase [Advenella kashmirensis]
MRVAIQTLGTRGDVQPYIALALGLINQGHEVQITAPVQFDAMVRERGIAFAPLPGEFLALLDTPQGKAAIAGSQGFTAGLKLLKHMRPLMRRLLEEEWAAVKAFAPDIIVSHPKSIASPHMAQVLKCPFILASPLPGFTPTSAFPSPMLPFATLGPLNRASHSLAIKGAQFLFAKLIRDWREASLGLSGRSRGVAKPAGTLYAYSPHVLPVPSDWDSTVLVSGYWFLDDEDWRPSYALASFLDAGEPPVYVGFGSMPGLDPQKTTEIIIEALASAGKRGLLASGGGALGAVENMPAHIYIVADAPHHKLFPHVGATIHHGGAGTTGASLRAGKPTTICPFFGDQPFWGRRVADLGVGPTPLDRKALSVDSVAAAIAAMDDPQMRERAAALGAAIGQENGIAAAVKFVEERGR